MFKRIKPVFIFFSFLILLISTHASAVNELFNYLGTGSPRLRLELPNDNGPKWDAFTIDYQGSGQIPWSADLSMQWSAWKITDETGRYFGTINLNSDGNTARFESYSYDSSTGNRLEGIQFTHIPNTKNYQLTVSRVFDGGPFPYAPVAKPAVYPNTSTPVILSVSGPHIINNKGYPIVLKGVARPSLEWNPKGQFLSPDDIFNMRKWGANVIRINLNQAFWFASGPISEKGSYRQIIDAMIYYAIDQNMAVILDLHWSGGIAPMANKDAIKFWEQVAWQYKDFGTVLFELYNEPIGIEPEVWLNGDARYAGYQELYHTVRRVGANNICIINGLDWGYDLSFVDDDFGLKGSHIVYGAHPYRDRGSDTWWGPGGSFANNFAGILGKYPIIFTEFGSNEAVDYQPDLNGKDPKYLSDYRRILDYAVEKNIHYTAFAWWVQADNPSFPTLISDWSGTPLHGGVFVKEDIQLRPGTPVNFH